MNHYLLHVRSIHEYNVVIAARDKKEAIQLAHDYDLQLERHAAIDWYGKVTAKGVKVSPDDFEWLPSAYGKEGLERLKQRDEKLEAMLEKEAVE